MIVHRRKLAFPSWLIILKTNYSILKPHGKFTHVINTSVADLKPGYTITFMTELTTKRITGAIISLLLEINLLCIKKKCLLINSDESESGVFLSYINNIFSTKRWDQYLFYRHDRKYVNERFRTRKCARRTYKNYVDSNTKTSTATLVTAGIFNVDDTHHGLLADTTGDGWKRIRSYS